MYLLKILAVVGVNAWIIVGTHRRLSRGRFARAWHISHFVLVCAGIALGVYLLSVRYLISPTARVYGVPFCVAGGDFMQGRWSDGGVGRFLLLAVLADVSCGVSACVLPLALGSFIFRPHAEAPKEGVPNGE
jgi:hypothetical protein